MFCDQWGGSDRSQPDIASVWIALAQREGVWPLRVHRGGSAADFYRILTEPEHNMLKQQAALLATEGIDLVFTEAAVREVARVAEEVNDKLPPSVLLYPRVRTWSARFRFTSY